MMQPDDHILKIFRWPWEKKTIPNMMTIFIMESKMRSK